MYIKNEVHLSTDCAFYNHSATASAAAPPATKTSTTMTEGETKIREARDRETLHPGMSQRPLSEDREGRVQEGLMEVIIRKINFRRD
jgi:hypothetical protein